MVPIKLLALSSHIRKKGHLYRRKRTATLLQTLCKSDRTPLYTAFNKNGGLIRNPYLAVSTSKTQ